MSDAEFNVLDELYFLQPFNALSASLEIDSDILKVILQTLLDRGWIKCYSSPKDEIALDIKQLGTDYRNYHYLATKAGLLAHNSDY